MCTRTHAHMHTFTIIIILFQITLLLYLTCALAQTHTDSLNLSLTPPFSFSLFFSLSLPPLLPHPLSLSCLAFSTPLSPFSESLLMLHKLLLSRIEACVKEPSPQFGELMCQFIPHMNVYTEFVKNHDQSIKVLEACLLNPSFTDFLENHHFSHDCDAQQLRMLLHQPVTRVSLTQLD